MARADEATRFQPSQSGNPKGRPKGSRHKLSEAALRALCANFEAGGAAAMSAAGSSAVTSISAMLTKGPIARMRRSCSDSPVTTSQMNGFWKATV
jgi:hypothetical protein